MTMTARTAIERLEKLARHLERGELNMEADFVPDLLKDFGEDEKSPGYFMYPFNECVYIFDEWRFDENGIPCTKEHLGDTMGSAFSFFHLSSFEEFMHLFAWDSQRMKKYGGKILHLSDGPEKIAGNIRDFTMWMIRRN
jgi:hypothetical protein